MVRPKHGHKGTTFIFQDTFTHSKPLTRTSPRRAAGLPHTCLLALNQEGICAPALPTHYGNGDNIHPAKAPAASPHRPLGDTTCVAEFQQVICFQ
ncbi:hypothetical protein SBA4_3070008 [Candidatus Sulfopaludibacter sp. SbA4]|nr:hypothetical protein SBA4_3070008 [Candidatus Sulfopaludibacter sp. SbA4]